MKNILADNLLRFGVRNLSESDIKTIKETVLTEAPGAPINGVVYKYPFTGLDQLNSYYGLMPFNSTSDPQPLTPVVKQSQDLILGLRNLDTALRVETAVQGILPTAMPFNLDQIKKLATTYMSSTHQTRPLSSSDIKYVNDILANPFLAKWYNTRFLPRWKNAYATTFPATPTTAPTPAAAPVKQ